MYIPQTNHINPNSLISATAFEAGLTSAHDFIRCHNSPFSPEPISLVARRLFAYSLSVLSATVGHTSSLGKRSGADDINTTIGVVVGVLLAVFLIGAGVFLYFYGRSIRFTRRKHHRRKSYGSKGSKNSEGIAGAGGGDPPAPA